MPVMGVTGHMDLTEETTRLVRDALGDLLARAAAPGSRLVGVSCLAPGADSLFAHAVVEAGGSLVAVLPSRDHRDAHVASGHAQDFDRLLTAASDVVLMPFEAACDDAYVAANDELLRRVDLLVAVWDGTAPPGKRGGTADTVRAARQAGVPVRVVWPANGARRGA